MSPTLPGPTVAMQVEPIRLVVPSTFALIGVYLVYTGIDRIRTQRRAVEEFVAVDATVRSSELGVRGMEGKSQTFYPDIDYEYEYEDQSYDGEVVFPGGNYDTRDRDGVERMVDNYNRGDAITAFVDPEDPEESYLVEGELRTAWTFVAAGIVLVLVAVGLVAYASTL